MSSRLNWHIARSRKWAPSSLDNLIENPPKSPFCKGGLSKGLRGVPPFDKGGLGGISPGVQVRGSSLENAPISNYPNLPPPLVGVGPEGGQYTERSGNKI